MIFDCLCLFHPQRYRTMKAQYFTTSVWPERPSYKLHFLLWIELPNTVGFLIHQRMFILHICQQIVTMSRLFFTQDNTASTLLLLYVNMSVFCAYTISAFTCWRLKVIMCVGFELSVPEHVYLFVLINSLFLVLGWCDTL